MLTRLTPHGRARSNTSSGASPEAGYFHTPGDSFRPRCIVKAASQEGPGWIILDWDAPPDETGTGAASAYKVQRARSGKDKWTPAGTAVHTTIVLKDQERGVEWQYRVIAVNRAGEGRESNVMTAVL